MGAYDWLILSIVVFLVLAIIANAAFFSHIKNEEDKQVEKSQNFTPLTGNNAKKERNESEKIDEI